MTLTTKALDAKIRDAKEQLVFLQGFAQGVDKRIEALEKRLKVLEDRVTQPVGGPGKR